MGCTNSSKAAYGPIGPYGHGRMPQGQSCHFTTTMNQAISVPNNLEGTSRKRRRTVDEEKDSNNFAGPLTRDVNYYMDSGDCIIRVERTLFKV